MKQRFLEWCRQDLEDETKINYTCIKNGRTYKFTSEDEMNWEWLYWLQDEAYIERIEKANNEWVVLLVEE